MPATISKQVQIIMITGQQTGIKHYRYVFKLQSPATEVAFNNLGGPEKPYKQENMPVIHGRFSCVCAFLADIKTWDAFLDEV
jgi:hypothetical protein